MENKKIFLVLGNSLAVFFTIIVNALANILPINGKNTGELSDNIPNLFVPTGITFAIWGVIYLLILLFMIYQINEILIKKKDPDFVSKIGFYFILASLANIIWIFMWHYELVIFSILPMIILFISLLMIYLRLDIGNIKTSLYEKMFVHLPISVYLGWITVATIANITAILVVNNVGSLILGEVTWTILVIFIATLITVIILINRRDIFYSLVIIWALIGIIIKRIQLDQSLEIAYFTVVCLIFIAITIFIISLKVKNKTVKLLKNSNLEN